MLILKTIPHMTIDTKITPNIRNKSILPSKNMNTTNTDVPKHFQQKTQTELWSGALCFAVQMFQTKLAIMPWCPAHGNINILKPEFLLPRTYARVGHTPKKWSPWLSWNRCFDENNPLSCPLFSYMYCVFVAESHNNVPGDKRRSISWWLSLVKTCKWQTSNSSILI